MKKVLFIDRDGTLVLEPFDNQVDSFNKLRFYPGVFTWLGRIAKELEYELVMVSNQDGLGTSSFPKEAFLPVHQFIMNTLSGEGIFFSAEHIDDSTAASPGPNRKPSIGMLHDYTNGSVDMTQSYVIGDRLTDVQLAYNLGCNAVLIRNIDSTVLPAEGNANLNHNLPIALQCSTWEQIYHFLKMENRTIKLERQTHETDIKCLLNLDGSGKSQIRTGLNFFDHMLTQLVVHSGIDLELEVKGDLHVDEHHTIEDTALVLGEAFLKALGNKKGLMRYGFCLPMDDCLAQVSLDFGGRPWLVWKAEFKREKIGDMPTEMFMHFFKSFCDAARCNLHIQAEGENEHHKIESIFKALAKSIQSAILRIPGRYEIPSSKGSL